jgi:lysophospholipase L1-like esterase
VPRVRIVVLPVLLVAVCTLAFGVAPASAVSIGTVNYVALGDSYSSGVGAGSYLPDSGSCLRSTNAYPQLWTNAHGPSSFVFAACSGANTTDVSAGQLGALSGVTSLVSISVGGNDVGFSDVMLTCVVYGTNACVAAVNTAENTARTSLPGWLDAVYNNIRSQAPRARVVVLGYPRFYHDVWYCIGLSSTSRNKINEGADVLDGVILAAAYRHGFAFADVRSAFANGHEICDGGSWLHSVDWANLAQSYHPTASGQSGGYLPAFAATTG